MSLEGKLIAVSASSTLLGSEVQIEGYEKRHVC